MTGSEIEVLERGDVRLLLPASRELPEMPAGFCERAWRPPGAAAELGRGAAYPLSMGSLRCFYREFRRGGLTGRVLADRYRGAGLLRREIEDSLRLTRAGVQVAPVVLGRVEPARFGHRLALVTERLEGATLADRVDELLASTPPARLVLRRAGELVARAHEAGFAHHDLHPGNLFACDDGSIALLDLAGSRWGISKGDAVARRSLVRLARWVAKHSGRVVPLRCVLAFLRGYEADARRRRELLDKLRPAFRRALVLHSLLWRQDAGQRAELVAAARSSARA